MRCHSFKIKNRKIEDHICPSKRSVGRIGDDFLTHKRI